MKKIKIQQVISPDKTSVYIKQKYYCVYLGEQKFCYFNNEVKALRFLAETNRFYNSILHEQNYLYTQLFLEYRNTWFYISETQSNLLFNKFTEIDKNLNFVITKSTHYPNGNPMTFQYLSRINTSLLNIVLTLRNMKLEKDYFHEVQRIDIYTNQINSLITNLNNWGKNFDGMILDVV